MLELVAVLAQNAGQQQSARPSWVMTVGLVLMVVVFYVVLFRGSPKARKQREELLKNLKKNDRVMTIGGIVGTVVNVKEKEVTVKVDETTNTKMTFVKDAIRSVVTDEADLKMEDAGR